MDVIFFGMSFLIDNKNIFLKELQQNVVAYRWQVNDYLSFITLLPPSFLQYPAFNVFFFPSFKSNPKKLLGMMMWAI